MIQCPACGHENIAGVDACEACGHSLSETSLPRAGTALERRIVNDRVGSLPERTPVTCQADHTVRQVLELMARERVGCCVVVDGEKVAGIFTERDVVNRIGLKFTELADAAIRDYMTPNPETLDVSAKIAFALHKMDLGSYRHVPITKDGKLHGVVSVRDMLRYCRENLATVEA